MSAQDELLENLLRQSAAGDMEAFKTLYDEIADRLYSIAYKILREGSSAEDAVQDAFLRIWRNAGRYEASRGAPLAWMGVIARNAALDAVKTRRPMEELDVADKIEFAVMAIEPPDARLGACLKQLPIDQARAITTMYTYGMSHSELAQHLNIPLGTVKSWVRRGTQALKQCMDA